MKNDDEEEKSQRLEFVRSHQGHYLFVSEDYVYMKERERNGRVSWKCLRYLDGRLRCPARCTIQGSHVTKTSFHCHAPDVEYLANKQRYFRATVGNIDIVFPT